MAGPGERTTRWTQCQKDGTVYESPVDLESAEQRGTRDPVPCPSWKENSALVVSVVPCGELVVDSNFLSEFNRCVGLVKDYQYV